MTQLDSVIESRDVTNKGHPAQAVVSPMVMHGCESWTIKKAECRRIDASDLWCWRSLSRVGEDREAWGAAAHGAAGSQTRLSDGTTKLNPT